MKIVTGRLAMGAPRSDVQNWLDSAVNSNGAVSPEMRATASRTPVITPASEAELIAAFAGRPYSCIGQSHSYNGIQVVPGITAFHMGKSAFRGAVYDPATQTATCGPSVKVVEFTVTRFAVTTSFVLKVAAPVTVTVSVFTRPEMTVRVGVEVVVPSYALLGAVTEAISETGVMEAATVCPVPRV